MVALTAALSTPVLAEKKKRGAGKEKNFVSLFDGTSTDQWMNAKSGKFPEKGWVVEDGCLKHVAKGGDSAVGGLHERLKRRAVSTPALEQDLGVAPRPRARAAAARAVDH